VKLTWRQFLRLLPRQASANRAKQTAQKKIFKMVKFETKNFNFVPARNKDTFVFITFILENEYES